MSDINRRLKKVEKAMNVHEEKKVAEVALFCVGELPPEYICGNITIRHIRYSDLYRKNSLLCALCSKKVLKILFFYLKWQFLINFRIRL